MEMYSSEPMCLKCKNTVDEKYLKFDENGAVLVSCFYCKTELVIQLITSPCYKIQMQAKCLLFGED